LPASLFLFLCLPACLKLQSLTLYLPVSFSLPACLLHATVVNFMSACFFSLSACLPHATSRQFYVCLFLFLFLPACLMLQSSTLCLPVSFSLPACQSASFFNSQLFVCLVSFSLPACVPHASVVNFMSACFFFSACRQLYVYLFLFLCWLACLLNSSSPVNYISCFLSAGLPA
jgi:hypothetical protein